MKIPKQLQDKRFRFLEIRPGTKKPVEDDWNVTYNYKYDDPEFIKYLETAKSYGVACRYGKLAIIDCDKEQVASDIFMKLPSTFTVKTGSGGIHFYYIVEGLKDKIVMIDNSKIHHGEVQFTGAQALGANSLHPNGKYYEILHDNNISTITEKQLLKVIKPYCREKKKVDFSINKGFDLDILKVAETIKGLDMTKEGLQGANPQHGSTNGSNLCINLDKGTWFCHRCQTGGDALYLVALVENLIPCEEIVPGYFKSNPEIFKKTLDIARDKYGYNIPKPERKKLVQLFTGEKNTKLNVKGIVQHIMSEHSFITVRDATSRKPHIYIYQDGYYKLNGDIELDKIIKQLFTNVPWKSFYRNEIMEYLRTENIMDRDKINPPHHLINLNNGVYDLKTGELKPHTDKNYFLYKVPVNYNSNATMPKITEYFNSTLKSEYVKMTQEIFGYCLYYDYDIHGIIYLYGKGGNGKSVWIHLLTSMVGKDNSTNKEISSLMNSRFTGSCLYGKLVNVCGEISQGVMKNTDMLKRLSAGDAISAEFKGKDAFDFYNRAKIITACNEIPMCEDTSDGWIQRQYIIPFLKKFRRTEKDDIHLKSRLTNNKAEMEGLLLWSLRGLKRLLKDNQFSYNYDMEERYMMYQQNSKYFLTKCYSKGNFDDFVEVQDIRTEYSEWCEENDVPEDSDTSLARKLTKEGYVLDRMQYETEWKWVRRYLRKV